MTEVKGTAKIEFLPQDHRYVCLLEDFEFYSSSLEQWSKAPKGFICDLESVPLLKGTNPESGIIHDLVCRTDFLPAVSKTTAMQIYWEFQGYYDQRESGNIFNRAWDWIRRGFKSGVVWVAPCYWQKFPIMATYEELSS
jgi:hypothetical protein